MERWCLYTDTELGWNRRILASLPERKTASDGSDFLCSDAGKCWIKGSEHRDGGGVSAPMPESVGLREASIGMEDDIYAPMPEVAELREMSIGMEGIVSAPMLTDAESVKYDTGKFKLYEVLRNFYD